MYSFQNSYLFSAFPGEFSWNSYSFFSEFLLIFFAFPIDFFLNSY